MSHGLIVACCTVWTLAFSVSSASQAPTLVPNPVSQLESPDPIKREAAFEALQRRPGALSAPGMAAILMRLLERENEVVISALRESRGREGATNKYGESWGEYYGDLFHACFRYCDKSAVLELVFQNERSQVPGMRDDALTTLGQVGLPSEGLSIQQRARVDSVLTAAATDTISFLVRQQAIRSLDNIVRNDATLTADRRARIHAAIVIEAGTERYLGPRVDAIRTLGDFRDRADVTLLKQLATQDTTRTMPYRAVRAEAQRAMAKISPP